MTTMTIVDVCNYAYPGQFDLGNISFGQDTTGPIFITKWAVDNVPMPTIEELTNQITTYQAQFDYDYFVEFGTSLLNDYVDSVAQQKNYSSSSTCASYINSSNQQWKNEASTFISWRDSVYSYVIAQQLLMKNGSRSIPTFNEFKIELPIIVWP